MASTISAGTTSGTALNMAGDTSGNLALKTQNGANTITVPNATGTMMVSGNQPAFRVYLSATQTITTGVATKVAFDSKVFDTASCFNTSTNRFTPTVAGYYQINVILGASNVAGLNYNFIELYKNGSPDLVAIYGSYGVSFNTSVGNLSALVYMNGSTDYLELYAIISGTAGTSTFNGGSTTYTVLSGSLVRTE